FTATGALFAGYVALRAQQLGQLDGAAGGAAQGVVAEAGELVVVLRVLAQAANGYLHAALVHAVEAGLRAVGLVKVAQELLRRAGEAQLLRAAPELRPAGLYLVHGGLPGKAGEHGGHVAVRGRHAEALGGDERLDGGADHAALDAAPDLHRLALALFLLAADVGDDIVHHLRPGAEGLAGAGDGLV